MACFGFLIQLRQLNIARYSTIVEGCDATQDHQCGAAGNQKI
jgi:hypothetical protein